jgi:hypothetical protein
VGQETQLTGFPFTMNAVACVGAFALADWKPALEVQLALPLIHGALLMCRVSEVSRAVLVPLVAGWLTLLWQACPDTSIVSYASTQRVMLATLVGLSALAMVLRVVDRVPVLWHGASLMVRALCLGIVGVHIFLEASAPVGAGRCAWANGSAGGRVPERRV